jgi:hypothetical protein
MRVAGCGLQSLSESFNLSVVLRWIGLIILIANSKLSQYIYEQTAVEFAAVITHKYA